MKKTSTLSGCCLFTEHWVNTSSLDRPIRLQPFNGMCSSCPLPSSLCGGAITQPNITASLPLQQTDERQPLKGFPDPVEHLCPEILLLPLISVMLRAGRSPAPRSSPGVAPSATFTPPEHLCIPVQRSHISPALRQDWTAAGSKQDAAMLVPAVTLQMDAQRAMEAGEAPCQ